MKLDIERLLALAMEDNGHGICLACGEETMGVEPDAERYECPSCGAHRVYGVEQVLMMVVP